MTAAKFTTNRRPMDVRSGPIESMDETRAGAKRGMIRAVLMFAVGFAAVWIGGAG